mgnify:CR=1 FL=1
MVYITGWVKTLIERYYGQCNLEKEAIQLIESLPTYLHKKLGKSKEFWIKELSNSKSKIHQLNLLEGSVERAIKLSEYFSEKTVKDICEYLKRSLENNWIGRYIAGYIKGIYPIEDEL